MITTISLINIHVMFSFKRTMGASMESGEQWFATWSSWSMFGSPMEIVGNGSEDL